MIQVKNLVLHELEFPTGILAATHTDCRPPFLKVYLDDDEGIHAFEEARIRVVSQMSLDQVQFQQTESANNRAYDHRGSFHYHLRRWRYDDLVHDLRIELRSKMNPAGGFSPEKQFKPLSSTPWYCEKVDSDSHVAKRLRHPRISVSHFNLDFVFQVHYLDIHKLKNPAWISATAFANSRSPLSSIHSN